MSMPLIRLRATHALMVGGCRNADVVNDLCVTIASGTLRIPRTHPDPPLTPEHSQVYFAFNTDQAAQVGRELKAALADIAEEEIAVKPPEIRGGPLFEVGSVSVAPETEGVCLMMQAYRDQPCQVSMSWPVVRALVEHMKPFLASRGRSID